MREAYRRRGWAFKNPDTIEQCRREGFSQKMQEQKNEGCQVYGFLEVNKVPGGSKARQLGESGLLVTRRMRGNVPYRWLETSTLPLGRASNSLMCMVSDPGSVELLALRFPRGSLVCPLPGQCSFNVEPE